MKVLSYEVGELEQVYLETVNSNLLELEHILEQIGITNIPIDQFREILLTSSKNLTSQWHTGRKVIRTGIAKVLIPGYPDNVLRLSLSVDAMINLLDDLLDEIMEKEQTAMYILEIVRIFAIFNQLEAPPQLQRKIASYFNKCIGIVIPEIIYKEKIKAAEDFEQKVGISFQCYNAKSMVMDIFMELPLIELFDDRNVDKIVEFARIHRAVALINKDFNDLEHDKFNETETPLVLLSYEGEENLKRYMLTLMELYQKRAAKFISSETRDFEKIISNIQSLVAQEIDVVTRSCSG